MLSHAFSEAALLEQEPLLTKHFDLLTTQFSKQIDGPNRGIVDLTQWYAYETFDIIGDLTFGQSFDCVSTGRFHKWIAKIISGVKVMRFLRISQKYPLIGVPFLLLAMIPAVEKEMQTFRTFPAERTKERLAIKTDRKDFMTYVRRASPRTETKSHVFRSSDTIMREKA
jgi:Cytochrome P450